jgi:hypothetical protein
MPQVRCLKSLDGSHPFSWPCSINNVSLQNLGCCGFNDSFGHRDIQPGDIRPNDTQTNDTYDKQQSDTQNNDIQHNNSHHNDTQHNEMTHNGLFTLAMFVSETVSDSDT